MKTKSMIAGMLSVMMLAASCSKEEGPNGQNPTAGAKTYASFSVSIQGTSTRAASTDPNAVAEETKISDLTLYIFNGGVLESTGKITLDANNKGTDAIATTTGPKTVYAVANKSVTGAVGSLQSEFEEQLITAIATDIAAANTFFMAGSTATTLIKQDEQAAIANPVSITVTRGAAKVQMKFDTDVPVKPVVNAAVANAKFTLAQQNTNMYLKAQTYSPNGETADQKDEKEKDGTYDHLVALPTDATTITWTNALAAYDNAFANSQYLAENINEAPLSGNTSYVLVGLQVTPKESAAADGTLSAGGFTASATFYVISKTNTVDGTITFATKDDKILYFADQTIASSYLQTNGTALTGYAVTAYTNGMSYYRLNIRDITKTTNLTEKYAVLRNNYYKVNISEISNLGFNTPAGTVPTDPTTPLETQTYISADITIEPWTVVSMNEPLG